MTSGPEFSVEMVGNRITSMGYGIPIDQADAKALEAAKEAALVTLDKPVPLVHASRSFAADRRDGTASDVYRFNDESRTSMSRSVIPPDGFSLYMRRGY
ncbi:hypothetical protein ABD76_08690 [Paenibacillus dendritiformis]|uniref:hypothetical protein n=1 Tax=Paenibacillus dendritiformis TaxID=130049 RepID=UPI0018CD981F|nr:hypothetical protein [Paenibacillus dendritiformis]MBG9792570.1 hypothetical protein [Paenibacillus dendritiformis]